MTRPFKDFSDQFFWNFKRMDNVNYNFKIVEFLYASKKVNNGSNYFNKSIIILIIAIIECALYDFILRINQHSSDSLPNLPQKIVSFFRDKVRETDELKALISQIRSQNLLRVPINDTLYDDLEHLRKVRNRIHIQNKYSVLDKDEYKVFTELELKKTQECLEKVYDALCNIYPRWHNHPISMSEFPRPWL